MKKNNFALYNRLLDTKRERRKVGIKGLIFRTGTTIVFYFKIP